MALCLLALAASLVPSRATWPSLTSPALRHSCRNLHEERGERGQMVLPEVADGAEVGPLHAGHRHEVETLLAGFGDPPRGVEALGQGVQQERHHHRRVIGRLAARLVVLGQDRRQLQLAAHQLAHQMCRMWLFSL